MNLAPIGKLIGVKARPETVLEVSRALQTPARTVADYVFTNTIRQHFLSIFNKVESEKGQAFWVRAQYGGGKTHFLATLAALLLGSDEVWGAVEDGEIAGWRRRLANVRLFPVVFSLRGRSGATADVAQTLYQVFEEEIKQAAQERLGLSLHLSTEDEVMAWWGSVHPNIRGVLNDWISENRGRTADDLGSDPASFKEAVLAAAEARQVGIPLTGRIDERLVSAYRQIVNRQTGYSGLLVIIDEFASWQMQHPEGGPEFARDEEFLETLGWSLPKTRDLSIYTIVASQRPQPAKLLAGQQEGRFITRELSSATDPAVELKEYEQIVSHRVRELKADRAPEIEEYYQDAVARYTFASSLELDHFRTLFPLERTCYDILKRITDELAAERVGINVVWEVLAEERDGVAVVRSDLFDRSRLIFAPDLLTSPNLRSALTEPGHEERFRLLHVAQDSLQHFGDLDEDERRLARDILDTLFLWHLAHLRSPQPMSIDALTAAVLAEPGMYNDAKEAVVSVLEAIKGHEQISYDKRQETVEFLARAMVGRTAQSVFDEYRRRPVSEQRLEQQWRAKIVDQRLVQEGLTALLAGLNPGEGHRTNVTWEQVEYEGRQVVLDYWLDAQGNRLNRDEGFFRLVYLLRDQDLDRSAIQDDRIAVCVPGPFGDAERDALRDLLALDDMETDYQNRDDDEGLRVKEFVRTERPGKTAALLAQQQARYRNGRIVTRAALNVGAVGIFNTSQSAERTRRIVDALFAQAFRSRPLGTFSGNAPFGIPTTAGLVFDGLFKASAPARAKDAARNFAVGLGLTTPAAPLTFSGDGAPALQHLRTWFAEAHAAGQALPAWQIYDRFADLGIPPRIATLFFLAFVRRPAEGAEIVLKPNASLQIAGSRITRLGSAQVPQLDWGTQLADGQPFESLAPRKDVDWGVAIEWLRPIEPRLRASNAPEEIESQAQLVLGRARDLAREAPTWRDAVAQLGRAIGEAPPGDLATAVDACVRLGNAETYSELYERANEAAGGDREQFAGMVAKAQAAGRLAVQAIAVERVVEYLRQLEGRIPEAERELDFERKMLLQQITLSALVDGGWDRLQGQFETFRSRYRPKYQRFHRDYVDALKGVAAAHGTLDGRLRVLERLDQIQQLGVQAAPTLRSRWQGIGARLSGCTVPVSAVTVEDKPVCATCGLPYGAEPPIGELAQLQADVAGRIDEKAGVLRGLLIGKIRQDATGDVMKRLADAILVGSDALVEMLANTEEAVALIKQILAGTAVHRSRAIQRLKDEFPTCNATNLDRVVARLRELLEEELAGAGLGAEVRLD